MNNEELTAEFLLTEVTMEEFVELQSNIEDLRTDLSGKQDTGDYALQSDITELRADLNEKQPAGDYALQSDISELRTDLNGKQDTGDYALQSDITELRADLNEKQPVGDYALQSDISELRTDLNGKQDTGNYASQSDLENIQTTVGEKLNISFNNITNTGKDLSNLSQTGEAHFANPALGNLNITGENRLHALKGYEDNGTLLTDAEGLADVKSYAHSTFDLSKFTLTGTPTITNDGIASGFSSSNYINTGLTCLDFKDKSWAVEVPMVYLQNATDISKPLISWGVEWSENGSICYITND